MTGGTPLVGATRIGSVNARNANMSAFESDNAVVWMADTACEGMDVNVFILDKGDSAAEAKKTCADCPVRAQCLAWALEHDERFGVWGGKTARERAGMGETLADAQLDAGVERARNRLRNAGLSDTFGGRQ
jgi:WhiB family redox-sensing transcriptional regulator